MLTKIKKQFNRRILLTSLVLTVFGLSILLPPSSASALDSMSQENVDFCMGYNGKKKSTGIGDKFTLSKCGNVCKMGSDKRYACDPKTPGVGNNPPAADGTEEDPGSGKKTDPKKKSGQDLPKADTVECSILGDDICKKASGKSENIEETGIWKLLLLVLNILSIGVGIAAVGGIVYASIIYTTAQSNSENTKKAKDMIVQVVWGLLAYAFMYLMLNYLIPGGIFS